jgi:hypothetical protein
MKIAKQKVIVFILAIISSIGFLQNMNVSVGKQNVIVNSPQPANAWQQLFDAKGYKESQQKKAETILQNQKLSSSILDKIEKFPVDIFPWELSILEANPSLVPRYRPYLQTAVSGKNADEKDALSFSDTLAPKYILWHNAESSFTNLDAFDGKYLPNEYPKTFWAIANQYQVIDSCQQRIFLMQKKQTPIAWSVLDSSVSISHWHSPHRILLPTTDSQQIIRMRVEWKPHFWQSIKTFFYKAPSYQILYQFTDGSQHVYSVSPRALREGVFANKIFINQKLEYKTVASISCSCQGVDAKEEIKC